MPVAPVFRVVSVRTAVSAALAGLVLAALTVPVAGPPVGRGDDLRRAATAILDDRGLVRSRGWRSASSAKAYLRTLTKSATKGATLTSPTSTTAGGSVRLQFGPGRGKVGIWVGGTRVRSVRTARATRKLVTVAFGGSGAVVLMVARPRNGVYVDKLVVSPPVPPVPPAPPAGPPAPSVGAVVITEFLADPFGTGDATKEWVELTSVAPGVVGLGTCVLGNGSTTTQLPAVSLAPGGIRVLAHSQDATQNGGLPPVSALFGFLLSNTSVQVSLTCGGILIDGTPAQPPVEGRSKFMRGNETNATTNDDLSRWCDGQSLYGEAINFGSPGQSNVNVCS